MERLKFYGAVGFTGVLLLGFVVWMILVGFALDDQQVIGEDGKTVVLDKYSRAKEIVTTILPLITTALGFWVGTKGTEAAKEETAKTKQQRDAFKAVAHERVPGEDIYELAVAKNRQAFGR